MNDLRGIRETLRDKMTLFNPRLNNQPQISHFQLEQIISCLCNQQKFDRKVFKTVFLLFKYISIVFNVQNMSSPFDISSYIELLKKIFVRKDCSASGLCVTLLENLPTEKSNGKPAQYILSKAVKYLTVFDELVQDIFEILVCLNETKLLRKLTKTHRICIDGPALKNALNRSSFQDKNSLWWMNCAFDSSCVQTIVKFLNSVRLTPCKSLDVYDSRILVKKPQQEYNFDRFRDRSTNKFDKNFLNTSAFCRICFRRNVKIYSMIKDELKFFRNILIKDKNERYGTNGLNSLNKRIKLQENISKSSQFYLLLDFVSKNKNLKIIYFFKLNLYFRLVKARNIAMKSTNFIAPYQETHSDDSDDSFPQESESLIHKLIDKINLSYNRDQNFVDNEFSMFGIIRSVGDFIYRKKVEERKKLNTRYKNNYKSRDDDFQIEYGQLHSFKARIDVLIDLIFKYVEKSDGFSSRRCHSILKHISSLLPTFYYKNYSFDIKNIKIRSVRMFNFHIKISGPTTGGDSNPLGNKLISEREHNFSHISPGSPMFKNTFSISMYLKINGQLYSVLGPDLHIKLNYTHSELEAQLVSYGRVIQQKNIKFSHSVEGDTSYILWNEE